jgi:hypothetical protein
LEIVDRADGTGVTAFVGNVAVDANVTLYRQFVDGSLGAYAWQLSGTRIGGGPIAVDVKPGYFWWYAKTDAPDLSPLVYIPATDGQADVQARLVDAAYARIVLLNLPGLHVYKRKVPWDADLLLPACTVTDFAQSETLLGGSTGHDEYGRPVYALFRSNDAHDETARVGGVTVNAGDLLRYWRGKIVRSFQGQRVPGVPESMWCEVEPAPISELAPELGAEMIISGLLIRCRTEERRGFGI